MVYKKNKKVGNLSNINSFHIPRNRIGFMCVKKERGGRKQKKKEEERK
jgi:hypothetical protein